MVRSESIAFDSGKLSALLKLVAQGEGLHLEFKRKASHPDKVVREIIAFANTEGGTILVGVSDDGSVPGVKFPEEESVVIHDDLKKHCRPGLAFHETIIPISESTYVLQWRIPKSDKRPHHYVIDGERSAFVRHGDKSLKASREMIEIIRRNKSSRGTRFTYGEAEQKIIHFLDEHPATSFAEISTLTGLNRFLTSRKLIRLVLANVLRITATEKGDIYTRA